MSGLYLPYLIFHWIWSVHRGQQLTTWVFWVARKQWLSKATCVFFITAILPSLWYLSVFHATVFCKIQLSKKCFFRFTAYKTSKISLTWCFCPGLVTLLAAVGRVFPWRFLAPQAALQEKRSSIFGVMKFRDKCQQSLYQLWSSPNRWGGGESQNANKKEKIKTYLLLIVNSFVPSFLQVEFLSHFAFFWNSEIQLAMKSSHSSLILWPISQCWWWCIINISINQDQLGISTDWMSLRQRGKKIRRFLKSRLSVVFFTFHLFVSVHYFHFWIWVQLGSLKRDVLRRIVLNGETMQMIPPWSHPLPLRQSHHQYLKLEPTSHS